MNEIQYIGEHLWVGTVGHFAIVLAFVAAILSTVSYAFSVHHKDEINSWKSLGRIGYIVHGLSIFTLMGVVFYAMYHHYYEYAYVYQHVSDDLPLKYVLSAFWEGQEGSFLLWMFWHIILGFVLIWKGGKWESSVVAVIAFSEVFLTLMILGVYLNIGDEAYKIGINPTILLRETMDIPLFANADYLSLINGTGLNPLLQNYWMTIHPPITFLGFASTVVPFAFAIAGLWTGRYTEWLKPALGWSLFSAGILGTGILMGALWAYEALSFGGYWAWDPVENAVLVPWLTLVAGLHTHLVAKSTGYSIRPTVFFYIMTFLLIVYSTFLTRSGVLGDTSVHAFTEMGLESLLILFMAAFLILGLGWFFYRYRSIPSKKEEESFYSREFWMFIGSLVLLFSAVLITGSTSLPVFNSIMSYFNEDYVGRVIQDPIEHYNKYQMWIAVFIAVLSGFTVHLRYKERNWKGRNKKFIQWMVFSAVVAAILTAVTVAWIDLYVWQYYLLAFASYFAVVANVLFLFATLRGNIKLGSSALAHLGFGLMIIGILASGLNKSTISSNRFVFKNIFNDSDVDKYVRLVKGKRMFGQGYWITYKSDTLVDRIRYYEVEFERLGEKDQEVIETFTLYPDAVYANDFSKVGSFNPDTKHYLHKDIFSCIVALAPTKSDVQIAREFEDTLSYTRYNMRIGDTLHTERNHYIIQSIDYSPKHEEFDADMNDFGVGINGVGWSDFEPDSLYSFTSALGLQGSLLFKFPFIEENMGMRIRPADTLMDMVFSRESELDYQSYTLKSNQAAQVGDVSIRLTGFNKAPEHSSYDKEKGDIAIGAELSLEKDGKTYSAEPIYIIRDNAPMGVKSYIPELGLHIRFYDIDPTKEEFKFYIAHKAPPRVDVIPMEIAENIPRTDYIILMANVFPGINLFWFGSILMMIGLFMAWIVRKFNRA